MPGRLHRSGDRRDTTYANGSHRLENRQRTLPDTGAIRVHSPDYRELDRTIDCFRVCMPGPVRACGNSTVASGIEVECRYRALGALDDPVSLVQDLEVATDRRLRKLKGPRELAHAQFVEVEQSEHAQTSHVAEGGQAAQQRGRLGP